MKKTSKTKKSSIKVRDLKPKKDAKGGRGIKSVRSYQH